MAGITEITRQENAVNHRSAPHGVINLLRSKRFWAHPWLILGVVIIVFSVTFAFMNNFNVTINFIGASMTINLPMMILGCALLGAAIEFFFLLGVRSETRGEIDRLKMQIRDLEAKTGPRTEKKAKQ